ncbi:hypothetical protein TNCV_874301 [Trichonephila clavipes]|nr:hypothetical protein TNCV_874301 [Trichonephila clavipes]
MYSAFAAGATLNSHRAAGPLVRLVEEREKPFMFWLRKVWRMLFQKRMVLLPEVVGEKGFLELRSPTFRIDSSGKGMRRSFEGPDWRQKA